MHILEWKTNEIKRLNKEVKQLIYDLAAMEIERDKLKTDLAAAQAVVRDICAEWNEDCDPDCDSIAHSPTCKATNIANAKRALQADLAAMRALLMEARGSFPYYRWIPDLRRRIDAALAGEKK